MTEPWGLTAAGLAEAYRSGACTPVDAVEACLARIEAVDGAVGAFTAVLRDRALDEARARTEELRAGRARGPLHGIPFAVKDLFDVEGTVTTAGSDVPVGGVTRTAARDAAVVARLRSAGGIVLGRTRTHEYAWGITTRRADGTGAANPWDVGRIAGGSSGGSAAAVGAGCVPVALGTDTGGSVRIPAAFCGTVGWKPAFGTLPLDGVVPLAPSLDHVGVLARTVEDAVLVHSLAAGLEPRRWSPVPVSGLRLGIIQDATLPALEPAVRAAFDGLIDALAAAGAEPVPVETEGRPSMETFGPIQMREALHVHREVLGTWPRWASVYGPDVADRLRRAETVSLEEASAASARREEIRRRVAASLSAVDAIVSPVVPCPPPDIDDPDHVVLGGDRVPLRDAVMPFTVAANLAGVPAAAVPIGLDDAGLPVSVQLMGPAEDAVLAIAGAIQDVAGPMAYP